MEGVWPRYPIKFSIRYSDNKYSSKKYILLTGRWSLEERSPVRPDSAKKGNLHRMMISKYYAFLTVIVCAA